jgi:hypothetical protein
MISRPKGALDMRWELWILCGSSGGSAKWELHGYFETEESALKEGRTLELTEHVYEFSVWEEHF